MNSKTGARGFHFNAVLLQDGWHQNVSVRLDKNGFFETLVSDKNPENLVLIDGYVVPGAVNLHSHAFQRAMAGLGEVRGNSDDSFWSWREVMYRFVNIIDPEDLSAIAAKLYVEFLKGGFTCVGEFHYLHHSPDGSRYNDPATMSVAIFEAAEAAGIALTHLPVFYAHSGFGGQPPTAAQKRFVHSLNDYARLLEDLTPYCRSPLNKLGIAPHSLRAVTPAELSDLQNLRKSITPEGPMHIHIAEQVKEVEDCVAHFGGRPVEWLLDQLPVDDTWCLIHATHMNAQETRAMATSGAIAGLCPMTEANLGDGIFPAEEFLSANGHYGVGTDSNIRTNVAEELQMLEYSQRLSKRRRNILADGNNPHVGEYLFQRACAGGARALAQTAGVIAPGKRADFLVLEPVLDGLPLAAGGRYMDYWLFGALNRAPRDVYVAGKKIISQGRHKEDRSIDLAYRRVMEKLLAEV